MTETATGNLGALSVSGEGEGERHPASDPQPGGVTPGPYHRPMMLALILGVAGALLLACAIGMSPRSAPPSDARSPSIGSGREEDVELEALLLLDLAADGDLDGDFERGAER